MVGEAADGAGALAEAARLQPAIVLLDVQLPDLDGFDVAARLTDERRRPAVVLTSSRDWSDSAELIARSGARGFVPKDRALGRGGGRARAMRSLRLALIGIGLAGLAAGAVSFAIAVTSDHKDVQTGAVVFRPLIGWSFIGTGLFAWWRRPQNRFGALMTAVGFVWFLSALTTSDIPGVFVVGGIFSALPYALLLHMLLAFPTGRLETRWERFLVGLGYFDATVMQLGGILFLNTSDPDVCNGCPANPLLISDQVVVSGIFYVLQSLIGIFGVTAIGILLVRRWRAASPAIRGAPRPGPARRRG